MKRIISLFLAIAISLVALVMPAHAVFPLGFAESILASYVASTGYKMWQDQAVGDSILQSLASLYSDKFLPQAGLDEVSLSQFALQSLLDTNRIGMDNSGNVVVSKMAADMFQHFADWLQTTYSIPDNSDTPVIVLPGTPGDVLSDGQGHYIKKYTSGTSRINISGVYFAPSPIKVGTYTYDGATYDAYSGLSQTSTDYYLTLYDGRVYLYASAGGPRVFMIAMDSFYSPLSRSLSYAQFNYNSWGSASFSSIYNLDLIPVSSSSPAGTLPSDYTAEPGVASLGLSIAKSVVDQAAKAGEDDAVVIGVGAQAGATAQEIADFIAQGINARTLNPSITITSEVVIDTPVQPYPDIDGLGLPELGLALVNRFPFCIPWDFVDTVRLLNADPVAPDILIDLFPPSFKTKVGITGDTSFRLNLGSEQYSKIGVYCRWASLISFCLFLALLTKRIVWTA